MTWRVSIGQFRTTEPTLALAFAAISLTFDATKLPAGTTIELVKED